MTEFYQQSIDEVLHNLDVNPEAGLNDAAVASRREEHGTNELPRESGESWVKLLISQFTEVMVLVLLAAAAISLILGDVKDVIVILAIVVLNAALGFYQEYQAEQALASLSAMQVPLVRVRREGHVHQVSAVDLVPGDIVLIESGDSIPADGRLIEAV